MPNIEHLPTVLLPVSSATATEFQLVLAHKVGQPTLTVSATGISKGVENIRIEPVDLGANIPIFKVVGQQTAAQFVYEYNTKKTFNVINNDINLIRIESANGIKEYKVVHLLSEKSKQPQPKSLTSLTDNQVVGYAYSQSDLETAFNNAVDQLQEKYPGNVSAKMIDSGFVAVGSPVGIAYTYVVMENAK